MKVGISLLRARPADWIDLAVEAERLGFESVWISDHLVLPAELRNDVEPDRPLPIVPDTPVFDSLTYLAAISQATTTLRLGTYVYQLALRHPFVAARSVATLDVISGGRVELGVGAGYVKREWQAAGVDFTTRGSRLDEALDVCIRLWTEARISHTGKHFSFDEVAFEPKPVQDPYPTLHIGGESAAAMARAVRLGAGWVGRHHTPETARPVLERLTEVVRQMGRDGLRTTVASVPGPDVDVAAWSELGIDRLICAPWAKARAAILGMREFADKYAGVLRSGNTVSESGVN